MTTLSSPNRLFLAYLVLTFYCFGTAVATEWLEYRTWADMDTHLSAADLAAWNMATTPSTIYFLTIPSVLLTAIVVALFWKLPAAVPRSPLWGVLACHLVVWAVYLLTQVPMNSMINDSGFVNLLVHSDWVRKLALLIEVPLALYMGYRAYWPAAAARSAVLNDARKAPVLG
jgi:hypothetical protein